VFAPLGLAAFGDNAESAKVSESSRRVWLHVLTAAALDKGD
jgi:hypothetical protein